MSWSYLSRAELDNLKNYQYHAGLYGFVDRVIMTPFWNRVVLLLPMNMAYDYFNHTNNHRLNYVILNYASSSYQCSISIPITATNPSVSTTYIRPNLVTLLALAFALSATAMIAVFDPTYEKPLPSWLCYFSAFATFMYQTLDAIDGKQARRTGSSSPLGQLFDHGNISAILHSLHYEIIIYSL